MHERTATASGEAGGGLSLDSDEPLYRVPFHPSGDGNTVEIGVEQAAFSQNASDFGNTADASGLNRDLGCDLGNVKRTAFSFRGTHATSHHSVD